MAIHYLHRATEVEPDEIVVDGQPSDFKLVPDPMLDAPVRSGRTDPALPLDSEEERADEGSLMEGFVVALIVAVVVLTLGYLAARVMLA